MFKAKVYSPEYNSKLAIKNLYDIPYIDDYSYNAINKWFKNLEEYTYSYEIKYFYLAIDALQKYNVENDKVEKLKKICNEHEGVPCRYEYFLKVYAIYCGAETKFENNELEKLINEIYEKRVNVNIEGTWKISTIYGAYFLGDEVFQWPRLNEHFFCILKAR